MKHALLQELLSLDTTKVSEMLMILLKGKCDSTEYHIKSMITAYLLYKIQTTCNYSSLNEFLDKTENKNYIREMLEKYGQDCWEIANSSQSKFTAYELLSYVLFHNPTDARGSEEESTPIGVLKLVSRILNIQEDDRILDICSGKGNFGVVAKMYDNYSSYTGVELNYRRSEIAKFRLTLLEVEFNIVLSDALEYRNDSKVDKVFSNYPFALNIMTQQYKELMEKDFGISKSVYQRVSTDWLFNLVALNQLNDTGKAVVIIRNGSTWNDVDKTMRQYFIENGFVEAVISLPTKLFDTFAIPVSLLVLSKNNQFVKMIDASSCCDVIRRKNVITDAHIEQILHFLENEGSNSVVKTIEELSNNDYVLNASRYLNVLPDFKNGVEFGTVIKHITRGAQVKATVLDEYKSNIPTNYRFLLLSNMNDGVISIEENEQYLAEIPPKLEKYLIKNNSLVLSKIGMPIFKSAVAQVGDGTKIIANGNLFVIELDEEKVNPYYIQAFLASDLGETVLKSIYAGDTILNLSLDKLKKMVIPLPSVEEQNKIAVKYAAYMDQLAYLRSKEKSTIIKMKHVFTEEE